MIRKMRKNNSVLWNYYDKDVKQKSATCRYCNNAYSFYSTTANLKQHLKRRHPEVFARINWDRTTDNEDDEAEELLKLTDVWNYFEAEGRQARCKVCSTTLRDDYEELKAHLKDHHPKILLNIIQNKEHHSDAASNDSHDRDNAYTEVVYLEQEALSDDVVKKYSDKTTTKYAMKREQRLSSDELPIKRKRDEEKTDESDELGIFIKYITCLLKKLPANVFSDVQVEIINTIMKANSRINQSVLVNREMVNTSANLITVNEITPVNNSLVGHNYTITVSPKETEADNNSDRLASQNI